MARGKTTGPAAGSDCAGSAGADLVFLKKLDFALVPLRGLPGGESTKVAPLAGLRILLAGV